jgi:two-component system response regulator
MTKLMLLVEDNSNDEKLTLLAFKKANVTCEIAVARDGAEALDYLFLTGKHATRDPATPPDLVLLDLKLPRISGHDVLRQIRAAPETRMLPVVMLSASGEDGDVLRSYALGANAYLRKSVDFAAFSEAARALAAFWLRFNEPPPRIAPP